VNVLFLIYGSLDYLKEIQNIHLYYCSIVLFVCTIQYDESCL